MEKRLIEDLSKLSNVEVDLWAKIFDNISSLIEEYVYESKLNLDEELKIDIEFATLLISNTEGKLKIIFIPKDAMVKEFKAIQQGGKTRWKKKLERAVLNNLLETYREI